MGTTENGFAYDGPKLKKYRLGRMISIAEVARDAGVAPSTIRGLEMGERRVKLRTLKRALEALGLSAPEAISLGIAGPGQAVAKKVDWAKVTGPHGWTRAHEGALHGNLPKGFTQWEIADDDGWTVAHVAAEYGNLPEGFDRWELANEDGWTVAHEAALQGTLPKGFDRWDLADKYGRTPAHMAAARGHLPKDFNKWDLADKGGRTVRQIADEWAKKFAEWREETSGKG